MSDSARSAAPGLVKDTYPTAIQPPIPIAGLNEPILLYSGAVDVTQEGATFRADARICLEWVPTPRVRFRIPEVPADVYPDLGDVSLRLDDGTVIERALVSNVNQSGGSEGHKARLSGLIQQKVIRPKDDAVSYVLFLLPNFEAPCDKAVSLPPNGWRLARSTLANETWRITLDDVEESTTLRATLQNNSGFAVTQIGRLERVDGKLFTAQDALTALRSLHWYVSFACGRWTGPCLSHGYDCQDRLVWQSWDYHRTVAYQTRLSWMDNCHPEHFAAPFPKFLRLWSDDAWEEVVRLAIHWYVEANAKAGSIEGSIVLTQTAFEMLSSFILVEQEGWLSADSCDKLPAADRIRLLLRWADIPTEIPTILNELVKLAKAYEEFMLNKRPDTAAAMTTIRNTITHPTRKNREKFGKHPKEARAEAWKLGLWVLELCLLRLFDYHGTYGFRLKYRYMGEVEQVPWSPKQP